MNELQSASNTASTPDETVIAHPEPKHPSYEVLGDLGLPAAPYAPFALKPHRRPVSAVDAGEHGLSALALNQCLDLSHLQSLLIADLSDGVSYLDAFDLAAMEERSHVYADMAHKQAKLLNTHLKLFEAQTTKLQLATQMIQSLNCHALLSSSDEDGCLKNLGLNDSQFDVLRPLLSATGDVKPTGAWRLSDVYNCLARKYTACEGELSQVVQDFLKSKQQAGRLTLYVACLRMLSGRATQLAHGIEQQSLTQSHRLIREEQAQTERRDVCEQLRKVARMPLVELMPQLR